ncbi:glutathione S-transferase [Pseudocolwellia agarivorans]|uniref:glutathione S-transferase n=1 Tax=Pseudocolwellia agarivorans TaxID=1911682 RepID=UPI0009856CF7|nr:glutathione S-transferase [Pseudocolwellia agarivorans]
MANNHSDLPILYSLRNCPYAMRARIAIFKAKQTVLLRDLVLSNKPPEMIAVSPKGTVPVIVLPNENNRVIEESLDVMLWALHETDPNNLLLRERESALTEMLALIHTFDHEFKTAIEAYKCAKRYKETNVVECRQACEGFIQTLEQRLTNSAFLMGPKESLADIALLPFIRQFARIERQWYLQSPYPKVRQWLNSYLQSPMFTKVMAKYPLWLDNHEVVLFGGGEKS